MALAVQASGPEFNPKKPYQDGRKESSPEPIWLPHVCKHTAYTYMQNGSTHTKPPFVLVDQFMPTFLSSPLYENCVPRDNLLIELKCLGDMAHQIKSTNSFSGGSGFKSQHPHSSS